MKPFRLINASEMQVLQQHFNQVIQNWNEEYAVFPLTIEQTTTPKNYHSSEVLMIEEPEHEFAFIEGDYLNVITHALFSTVHSSFNATSQKLLHILLNNLFKATECTFAPKRQKKLEWFYAGSTSLLLTIHCNEYNFTLVINPDWVYQQLPTNTAAQTSLGDIEDALAEHQIKLSLELTPSPLSVKNLANLHVGDVLVTNHPLSKPLHLIRGKELFAHADLGHTAEHKSIILKRSS
jgi:flagellar motor switch/type III secretory pathway protein FliN